MSKFRVYCSETVTYMVEVEELSTAEARKIRDAWNRKHAHLSYDGE